MPINSYGLSGTTPSFFDLLNPISLILGLAVLILFFLAIMDIRLWYWKANEIVELLKKIEKNTSPNKTEIK